MRAHVIENGKVVNTIEIERLDLIPNLSLVDASLGGSIGDTFDGKDFIKPKDESKQDLKEINHGQTKEELLKQLEMLTEKIKFLK